jgi:outer membrane protein OmpA-like peptidoglycan-associated protein
LFLITSITAFAQQESVIYFDFNKHELTDEAKQVINKIFFNKKVMSVAIYGHTDQFGSDEYNEALSLRRANTVKQYMISNGTDSNIISIVKGLGEKQLINTDTAAVLRKANRRVSIVAVYEGTPRTAKVDTALYPPTSTYQQPKRQQKEKLIDELKDTTIKAGQNIVLRNINFYGGRHVFLPQAFPPLQDLLEAMQKIPTLEIEIQGHICCQLGEEDGVDEETGEPVLSVNRAKAVYEFLLKKGINKNRMSYKGFGHKYPIIKVERNEEDATTNRRVEIKIIKK